MGPILNEVDATIYSYQKITVIDSNIVYIQRLWSVGPTNCLTDAYEYTWALCLIDRCEWALPWASLDLFEL